ncbi:MAG: DNA-processing protein DprA, partial [Bryobacteraceae bacterium]|nr:DNA-processing protein DprA [Bryobacteraceae bacterium]
MSIKTLDQEETLYWLALRLIPGLGAQGACRLLEQFRTPQAVFRASRSELEAAGLPGSAAQSIVSGCTFEDAVLQQEKMREAGASLVSLTEASYPGQLREIYDPPPVLFVRGRVELLSGVNVGVVGTRRPTPYGVSHKRWPRAPPPRSRRSAPSPSGVGRSKRPRNIASSGFRTSPPRG